MTALVPLAHGPRRPETESVLEDMVALVREKIPLTRLDVPPRIRLAWLDFDEPSLDTVCAELVAAGETQALAAPLLLTDALHSRVDVPEQVRLCDRHGIDITVTEELGLDDGTKRAAVKRIIETAENASSSWPADALMMGVGSPGEGVNAVVHQFVTSLDGMLPGHVSTTFMVGLEKIKGADVVAAAQEHAAKHGHGLVVVPLFTAPGLLWDRVTDVDAVIGTDQVASDEPLAKLLVLIVCYRWSSRVAYVDMQVVAQSVPFPS